jgi:hypothetical protein
MISGIANSVGLVSALLFGFLLEKRKVSVVINLYLKNSSLLLQMPWLLLDTHHSTFVRDLIIGLYLFQFQLPALGSMDL